MTFKDYEYKRIDIDAFKKDTDKYVDILENAPSYEAFKDAYYEFIEIGKHVFSMMTLSSIRNSINMHDEFYDEEKKFWDLNGPLVEEQLNRVTKTVLDSKYRPELEKDVPKPFFLLADNALKSFSPEIISDLQEENQLVSQYYEVVAKAQIEFDGKTCTLAELGTYRDSSDEEVRKDAYKATWDYYQANEETIDNLYDKLVKLRDSIAKKLGFNNFVEQGYVRMNRLDYNENDVDNYRKQVLKDVVPVTEKLYKDQMARIGVDKLDVYNANFEFTSGNPKPIGTKDEMVEKASVMYKELSPETNEFWQFMVKNDLLDLEAKPGKRAGGYCTYIPDYKAPFIFSNFNGTKGDVDVLTHEAGHAFQVFESRWIKEPSLAFPTFESCEIHSMSMEFFAWPWMESFFGQDTDKYYYTHLSGSIKFIPYGVLVDHFQHDVYNNVDWTPAQRKARWRELEKQYLPHKDYEAIPFLEQGTWWFSQLHIFAMPFYYIDYTLAQVCAFQFWLRLQKQDPQAFKDYYEICKIGGTKTFLDIVKTANLQSPFEDGALSEVMEQLNEYLDKSPVKNLK